MSTQCEFVDTVSDDAFGYWDEAWGEPSAMTVDCDHTATRIVTFETPMGVDHVILCEGHAAGALS